MSNLSLENVKELEKYAFHQDVAEGEEGNSCPPPSWCQSEGPEGEEGGVRRCAQSQEDPHVTHLPAAQDAVPEVAAQTP